MENFYLKHIDAEMRSCIFGIFAKNDELFSYNENACYRRNGICFAADCRIFLHFRKRSICAEQEHSGASTRRTAYSG